MTYLTKGKSCMFELTFPFLQDIRLPSPLEESQLWPWCTAQPDRSLTFDGTATRMLMFLHCHALMYMCTLKADSSFELNSNVYQALLNPEKAGDFTGEKEGVGCTGIWTWTFWPKAQRVCVCVGGGGGGGGGGWSWRGGEHWDLNLKHFDQKPSVFTTWPSHLLLCFTWGLVYKEFTVNWASLYCRFHHAARYMTSKSFFKRNIKKSEVHIVF